MFSPPAENQNLSAASVLMLSNQFSVLLCLPKEYLNFCAVRKYRKKPNSFDKYLLSTYYEPALCYIVGTQTQIILPPKYVAWTWGWTKPGWNLALIFISFGDFVRETQPPWAFAFSSINVDNKIIHFKRSCKYLMIDIVSQSSAWPIRSQLLLILLTIIILIIRGNCAWKWWSDLLGGARTEH